MKPPPSPCVGAQTLPPRPWPPAGKPSVEAPWPLRRFMEPATVGLSNGVTHSNDVRWNICSLSYPLVHVDASRRWATKHGPCVCGWATLLLLNYNMFIHFWFLANQPPNSTSFSSTLIHVLGLIIWYTHFSNIFMCDVIHFHVPYISRLIMSICNWGFQFLANRNQFIVLIEPLS
jgi:hypothetical protein